MVTVKVCGVRDAAGAEAIAGAGADYAGFIFVPGRRRAIEPALARELRPKLGATEPVGVFLDASLETIQATVRYVGLTHVQLHGSEPVAFGRALAQEGLQVIKAAAVRARGDVLALEPWRPFAHALLLDGPAPGSGEAFDLDLLPATFSGQRTWLAGGLNPENVGARCSSCLFSGVDVASGVEVKGRQSPGRIQAFVDAARAEGPRSSS